MAFSVGVDVGGFVDPSEKTEAVSYYFGRTDFCRP